MNPQKILVTGAAGFIGFHITNRLIKEGAEVVGLDNINDYYDTRLKYARLSEMGIEENRIQDSNPIRSNKYPHYRFIRLDIKDHVTLNRLFEVEKFDKVCHLAAQAGVRFSLENPYAYAESNLVGFINMIEACRLNGVKHLIYASSSSVYGANPSIPFSIGDNTDRPISLYGATKKSNELIAYCYSYLYKLPATGLRFFTVYGPWGRPDMSYFIFIKSILDNKPINIYNYGEMKRDFTYIDDAVDAILSIIKKSLPSNDDSHSYSVPYKIYNIGNGSPVSLMEFIDTIEKALGREAQRIMLPLQPGDIPSTWANIAENENDFDSMSATSLKEGISRFIEWYHNYYRT